MGGKNDQTVHIDLITEKGGDIYNLKKKNRAKQQGRAGQGQRGGYRAEVIRCQVSQTQAL